MTWLIRFIRGICLVGTNNRRLFQEKKSAFGVVTILGGLMEGKKSDFANKYSFELNEIWNKLEQLRRKKVYEISDLKSDGFIGTNADQLEHMIKELLFKIETGEQSVMEKLLQTKL